MSMLKKTLIYLGLGPDEEYDSFDDYAPTESAPVAAAPAAPSGGYQQQPQHQDEPRRPAMRAVPTQAAPTQGATTSGSATVRPIRPAGSQPSGSVRAIPSEATQQPVRERPRPAPKEIQPAVRIVESRASSPHALSPTSFNEAQAIGDRFKAGQAVIVNLQGADRDLRRRLVDFASGLCYALGGKMDRVADQVYLLTPDDVVVSAADTQRALD